MLWTHVLIIASCGSTSYFRCSRTLIMAASRPFREAMLSAKRQFMGILGLSVPSNRIFFAHSAISSGRVGRINGLFKSPSWKIWFVTFGMEYSVAITTFVPSAIPLDDILSVCGLVVKSLPQGVENFARLSLDRIHIVSGKLTRICSISLQIILSATSIW